MNKGTFGTYMLAALVVGNMVGSGIFMLPRTLADAASPAGVILAWVMTGAGVLMLALVFGNLSLRKPELNGGPQIYAKALFRQDSEVSTVIGYLVSWGYWVANWVGNVAIITTFTSYLSTFFPILTSTDKLFRVASLQVTVGGLLSFLVCSALLWFVHTMILRGVEAASKLNLIATVAKVIGFLFFIVAMLFVFEKTNLLPWAQPRLDGSGHAVGLFGQTSHAAIATLWAFIGVESAVVFSSRAKRRNLIKRATILGLAITVVIYIAITLLVMGVLPEAQLMQADKPLVDALIAGIGPAGGDVMAILGLVCLFGSTVGWILLSAEVAFQAAKQRLFPPIFRRENPRGVPTTSLLITNGMAQVFIFSVLSQSMAAAYNFLIFVATLSYLLPYIFAAVYQFKLTATGETYRGERRTRVVDLCIAVLATLYSLWVVQAGAPDLKTLLFGLGLLAVGIVFYPFVRRGDRTARDTKHKHSVSLQ